MYIVSLIKSLRPHRHEHWIMLSILIYSLCGVLKYYLPQAVCNSILYLCVFVFFSEILINIKLCSLTGMSRILFCFLVIWSLCITIGTFFGEDLHTELKVYKGFTAQLVAYFSTPYFLPNFIPFILLCLPRNYQFDFKYLWRIMWLLCILYLCYYPFSFWSMTHYSWSLDSVVGEEWGASGTYGDFITNSTKGISSLAPAAIVIFFKKYLAANKWKMYFIAYIGSLLISAYLARRGGLTMSLLYLVVCWLMYAVADKNTSKIKLVILGLLIVMIVFMLFNNLSDSFFSTLTKRGNEDTRGGVEDSFMLDVFASDDWILGRGWFGQYYESNLGIYRGGIETGYLSLILRGGIVYLIPYTLMLFISFVNGYFRSNNLLCKSFALMCVMQLVSLYPYGWPAFNFMHFIIWLGVWICNNSKYRKMSDCSIKKLYF